MVLLLLRLVGELCSYCPGRSAVRWRRRISRPTVPPPYILTRCAALDAVTSTYIIARPSSVNRVEIVSILVPYPNIKYTTLTTCGIIYLSRIHFSGRFVLSPVEPQQNHLLANRPLVPSSAVCPRQTHGQVPRGVVRVRIELRGVARLGWARHGRARPGTAGQGLAGQGAARPGKAWRGKH